MTRRINPTIRSLGLLGIVVVLWIISIARLQLSAIGDYGLISALPYTFFVALAILTLSMVLAVHRNERGAVLAAHVILFVLMVHGTPALTYATLRYAWAWKHLGLVDYLTKHHAVNPTAGDLNVYQNWPGFFSGTTTWLVGSGLHSWTAMAQWAPPAFELLFAGAVFALLRSLDTDRRLVWLAVWLFAIGNWVGQDYFSPQAYAYFLYLAVLVIVFRWLVRHPVMPTRMMGFVRAGIVLDAKDRTPESTREQTRAALILILLCVTAIATSHPLTPLVLLVALSALVVTRVVRVRLLPVMAAVPTGLWLVTGAHKYASANARTLVGQAGSVQGNIGSTLSKAAHANASQLLVSKLGRVEVIFLVAMALFGFVRRIRGGHWDLGAIVLAAVPASILIGGSYGGEAVFRTYLFSLPFLAYFAAAACYPSKEAVKTRSAFLSFVCCGVILSTFLFAYYGKERWSHYTRGEVRAAEKVFVNAQPDSLLIEGTADYPTHFANYDDFTYVNLSTEPPVSYNKVIRDPVATMQKWLADGRYSHSYLIITASQKAEVDALGELPIGALDKIERTLLASPKFRVLFHDPSASVFTLANVPAVVAAP